VVDRSYFTEILALLLAASVGWPNSGFTRTGQAAISTTSSVIESHLGAALFLAPNQGFKPVPERHLLKQRRVLDDDPAMLSDDLEDWIEDSNGLVAAYPAAPAHGSFFTATLAVGMNAGVPPASTAPRQMFCRYQC
jgi:hypothetical protein